MASTGKKKTTMAKLARESRLRERRQEKEARKRARKDAAANLSSQEDAFPLGEHATGEAGPADTADTADADRRTVAVSHQDDLSTGSSA
jgi:hypothetical protein